MTKRTLTRLGRHNESCLLYTSDAADERSSVDLGGRRIIKKKNNVTIDELHADHKAYTTMQAAER